MADPVLLQELPDIVNLFPGGGGDCEGLVQQQEGP